jgi:hypothetical protein
VSDEDRIDENVEPEAAPEAAVEPATVVNGLEDLEPPRNRTGLVVVIAAIVLILAAAVIGGPILFRALQTTGKTGTVSSAVSKQKIEVGISFVEALLNGETLKIKGHLTDAAQTAITEAQWQELASQDQSAIASFTAPVWSGDTTAVVNLTAQDATGTLTFSLDPAKPLVVVLKAELSGSTEMDTLTLVAAGSGWRVLSLSNGTETTNFDAELVKSMVATPTMGQ